MFYIKFDDILNVLNTIPSLEFRDDSILLEEKTRRGFEYLKKVVLFGGNTKEEEKVCTN